MEKKIGPRHYLNIASTRFGMDRRDNANIHVYMYADGATGRCSWCSDAFVRCRNDAMERCP